MLSDYKNKFNGKIAYVMGSGASLNNFHSNMYSKLHDGVVLYVNSSILFKDKINAPNHFFVTDDPAVMAWSYMDYLYSPNNIVSFVYKNRFEDYRNKIHNAVMFTHKCWYDAAANKYYDTGIKLTEDEPIIGTPTSAGSAVHIAYIMGCRKIVLMGCDCGKSADGKSYFWDYWPKHEQPIKRDSKISKALYLPQQSNSYIHFWESLQKECVQSNVELLRYNNNVLTFLNPYEFN